MFQCSFHRSPSLEVSVERWHPEFFTPKSEGPKQEVWQNQHMPSKHTMWGPQYLWFMVLICTYNYSIHGVYKPTHTWVASHCIIYTSISSCPSLRNEKPKHSRNILIQHKPCVFPSFKKQQVIVIINRKWDHKQIFPTSRMQHNKSDICWFPCFGNMFWYNIIHVSTIHS